MEEQQSEIDYSNMESVQDIRKRFNQTDYSRSIAFPKSNNSKPLPPAKPLPHQKPLIVQVSNEASSSNNISSGSGSNSQVRNPFHTEDQAERHFILTTSNIAMESAEPRSRTTSGGVVRKSVNDMFDDALKTAANPQGVYNLGSSSGVSMETSTANMTQSEAGSSQKPSPVQGQKPPKPKKPTYSGSTTNSRSRANSAAQNTATLLNSSLASESSSEKSHRTFSYKGSDAYLGSLKNDPNIDTVLQFCQATIDTIV